MAITSDGASVYVASFTTNTVAVLSTATNTVTATIPVGNGPFDIAFKTSRSPQDQIAALIDQIETLILGGTLTQNQGDGLIDKLNQVIIKLDNDQAGAACNQLSSFSNQVSAFINSGALTAEGQPLIDAANAIRTSLGCQ